MALNISILLMPWPVFLGALVLVITAIIILSVVERALHRRIIQKKEEEDTYFLRRLGTVKTFRNNPLTFLSSMNDLAREFFEEEFQITGARYSELITMFKSEKNEEAIKFCETMQETLYSGEKLTDEKLDFLFEQLSFLIRKQERERISRMKSEMNRLRAMEEEKNVVIE